MLVLTRKSEESVIIGNDIEIKVLGLRGDQVSIYRKEVYEAIQEVNRQAASLSLDQLEKISSSLGKQLQHRKG
jgi:carbon storage regulator